MSEGAKYIIAAVTNDLHQDQRMQRICSTLQESGYQVQLTGRLRRSSTALSAETYEQTRLRCWFERGKLFYLEYNFRLFLHLLTRPFDAVCAVDSDTLVACYAAARIKRKPCILDAHEYFSETPEVVSRPLVKAVWEAVARLIIPRLRYCYTVGEALAEVLSKRYHVDFETIRNAPLQQSPSALRSRPHSDKPFIVLYQGMLNAGRGLEAMLEAMSQLDGVQLWLAGDGDLSAQLRQQAQTLIQQDKVRFLGFVPPSELKQLTSQAHIGINLLDRGSLSYWYSLANKALDYTHAGIPSIQTDFPEYKRIAQQWEVFTCIPDLSPDAIAAAVRELQQDQTKYERMQQQCEVAAKVLCWQNEAPKLLALYERVFKTCADRH